MGGDARRWNVRIDSRNQARMRRSAGGKRGWSSAVVGSPMGNRDQAGRRGGTSRRSAVRCGKRRAESVDESSGCGYRVDRAGWAVNIESPGRAASCRDLRVFFVEEQPERQGGREDRICGVGRGDARL